MQPSKWKNTVLQQCYYIIICDVILKCLWSSQPRIVPRTGNERPNHFTRRWWYFTRRWWFFCYFILFVLGFYYYWVFFGFCGFFCMFSIVIVFVCLFPQGTYWKVRHALHVKYKVRHVLAGYTTSCYVILILFFFLSL